MGLGGSSWKVSVRLVVGRSRVRIPPRAPFPQIKGYQARRARSAGSGGGNLSTWTDVGAASDWPSSVVAAAIVGMAEGAAGWWLDERRPLEAAELADELAGLA
jgi:hypothetical protein